ncbi:hypothetical protein O3P69_007767 [Scylla paramamosain]|uniref:Uncharacterized protein n=1 Tax=Scylla paramamosain TaxID=85552 RepID=A0AAW0UX82_SCYPA
MMVMKIMMAMVVMVVMMMVVAGEASTSAFLHHSLGRRFFIAFVATHETPGVNIFVPRESAGSSVPLGVMREVAAAGGCSVAVVPVTSSDQVTATLARDSARTLNVALLDTPQQVAMFVEVSEASLLSERSWLVLGDLQALDDAERRPVLAIDNMVTFASLEDSENVTTTTNTTNTVTTPSRVIVREAYSVVDDTPLKVETLGAWLGGGGRVPEAKEHWSDRRTNLTGLHLRCTTMPQAPFVYTSPPDRDLNVNITGGFAKEIWDALQEILGFTYSCRLPWDRTFGVMDADGSWSGLVGELVEGHADVVVTALDHNDERAKAVTFVTGLREIGYSMVVRRPGLMEQTWTSFTSELLPEAWLGTIAFVVLAPPFLVLCACYSPFETERVTFKDAYILAIGAFAVQGSWLEVRSVSTRIVFITIFMATLVVYAHYTSALVSLLTVASTSVGFSSLQELVQDGSYRFGFKSGTLLEQEFRKAHHSVFRDVWEELVLPHADSLVTEDHQGIAKATKEKYVYMMEDNLYRSNYGNNCLVMQVRGRYFTTQTGMALRRHSPLTKILDAQLIKFRDGGLLSRAWRRWQPMMTHCTAQSVVAIELNHLFTAFLLLLLGMILSVVILPCERLHWRVVGRLKTVRAQQIQVMRQKGLVSPLPPPQDLPAASGDISLMGRLRYSTQYSPPFAPFGTL